MNELEELKTYGRIIIDIISCAIKYKSYSEINKIQDWDKLLYIADNHAVTNLLAYAFNSDDKIPQDKLEYINNCKDNQIFVDAHQNITSNELIQLFENNGIEYMLIV